VTIETERLLLREFRADDWPAVLAYQRDPLYLRFYEGTDRTEEDARAFVQRFVEWQAEQPRLRFQLAITLRASGELVGNVGVRKPSPTARVAELGYELAPGRWSRGYATEAARAMLAFAFGELGLHRVHAHCVAENTGSARVLERLGMCREGLLRQHEYFKDRWWDVQLFGLLASEWHA
jgi:ribosomal-protein-alanine N-acetyltransferase